MLKYNKRHFQIIKKWGLEKNPFRAIKDYSETKAEQRHLNKEWSKLYKKYYDKRVKRTLNMHQSTYYRNTYEPIDKWTWEYLRKRKQYFQMPLGWEEMVISGGSIIDVGCGDGDMIQNFIDFAEKIIKKRNLKSKIHVYGIDVNHSRVENAKKLIKTKSPNITFEIVCGDFASKKVKKFDYALIAGVFEILNNNEFKKFVSKLEKIIKKKIYVEDLMEQFPGGFPRYHIGKYFKKFRTIKKNVVFTEPLNLKKIEDPKKIWPIHIDQNVLLEKK
jgi:2-polyprenyl-3-methyl-5-hydroxy-6-metoxy-1,4-benzoquinol methylase